MKRFLHIHTVLLLIVACAVVFFQNCAESRFSKDTDAAAKNTGTLEVDLDDDVDGDLGDGGEDGSDNDDPTDDDPVDDDDIPDDDGPGGGGNGNGKNKGACGYDSIQDIVVNALRLEMSGGDSPVFEDAVGSTSLISFANGFFFDVATNTRVNQFRLILAAEGHYIVNQDDEHLLAKVPSGAQTGFKIIVGGHIDLEPGRYRLRVDLDPSTQVHRAGKKCIIKPTIKLKDVVNINDIF